MCAPEIYLPMVGMFPKELDLKPIVEYKIIMRGGGGGGVFVNHYKTIFLIFQTFSNHKKTITY
jgi:hypothetical protein